MMAAKALGIDPDLAVEAGDSATAVMNLIRHAVKLRGPGRDAALRDAERELGRISPRQHPELIEALHGKLMEIAGHGRASVNPATGAEEFFWPFDQLKDAASRVGRGIGSVFGVGTARAKEPEPTEIEPIYIKGTQRTERLAPQVLRTEEQRRSAILGNSPGRIAIEDPGTRVRKPSIEPLGYATVARHKDAIERIAKEENVDPDLVKTVMYAENARGHKFGAGYLADALGWSSSIHPMNINPGLWSGLGIDKKSAYDPETNIRAATRLIGRTWNRLDEPTAGKLVSLYEGLSQDKVSEYGAYGQGVYNERRWERRPDNDVLRTGYRGR
ncbi:MAG: hypothetical protein SFV19_06575 [Rhodospirillaceae bacterium]|nr:hypothetical protein [Rhodospirillaceae bacterium]